jgi:hypothetical protein
MRDGFGSRILVVLLTGSFLNPLAGCAERPGAVTPEENTSSPPKVTQAEEPAPSPILRKQKPQPSFELGIPLTNNAENPDQERLNAINDYLYSECSARHQKLTGFDHFLNQVWNWTNVALFGGALVGYLETQRKK